MGEIIKINELCINYKKYFRRISLFKNNKYYKIK
jgi:hypothetical protein